MSMSSETDKKEATTPCPVELSLNPEDGSLLTAPLSSVLLAATDDLYTDLYQMAHGEIDVAQTAANEQQQQQQDEQTPPSSSAEQQTSSSSSSTAAAAVVTTKKEKMSNLSFAQRRHQLSWRLAKHAKALSHVAGLTAALASSLSDDRQQQQPHNVPTSTRVSSRALQHARTAWVQADEAQDALYFFHAQLFPARRAPHDVYGALDVLQRGQWNDMSTDVKLQMDPYTSSTEYSWNATEVAAQWHMAVQTKLLMGEVGRQQQQSSSSSAAASPSSLLWNITLRGGVVKLTYGAPKRIGNNGKVSANGGIAHHSSSSAGLIYPIEAHVTVLSTAQDAEWTLLSVQVAAQPKTGESNHQLDLSNRQRFDLHRLCVQAMKMEESRARERRQQQEQDERNAHDDNVDSDACIARPLNAMFQVAHVFDLSWQLEILSAQAQALKRGVWAASSTTTTDHSTLDVTPVRFFENNNDNGPVLGVLSIAFWNVDDRYGPPRVGILDCSSRNEEADAGAEDDIGARHAVDTNVGTKKFVLSIWAELNIGMRVSLSGGHVIIETAKTDPIVENTVQKLLAAASDPFALSASDALLAATTLCGERKCHAVVQALQQQKPTILPKWMRLSVERGGIAVAAQVSYGENKEPPFVVLFRLECDARTGNFVCTFPRSTNLLRMLSSNDPSASDAMALRMAKAAEHRQKGTAATATGRFVKDSFEGLARSMNLLGHRTGVGGEWVDANEANSALRQRAIQLACADAVASLATCCGVAAVYGLSALALGVATGVTAVADIAGGPLETTNGKTLLPMPPLALVLDQRMVQKVSSADGDKKKRSFLDRDLFAVTSSVTDDAVKLHCFDVTVQLESPVAMPNRLEVLPVDMKTAKGLLGIENDHGRPSKRPKIEHKDEDSPATSRSDLMTQVEELAGAFSATLDVEKRR